MMDYLVFDLETQRSATDVGGWDNIPEMKVSVGVVWDSATKKFHFYYEDEVDGLINHLKSGATVIGYNHIGFDYKVLSGYSPRGAERDQALKEFKELPNLDLLISLRAVIGKRVKLDAVARPTLKVGKSADGLLALKWYQEYLQGDPSKLQMIADYCKQDVEVTRDIFLYGLKMGELRYDDKEAGIKTVRVDWSRLEEKKGDDDSVQLTF